MTETGNDFPIILIYGFMGFDSRSFAGLPYWGGTVDLEQRLRDLGYDVRTAFIGPVSSNWDRACELYAAIRGGRVDYGSVHSDTWGHRRFGRSFPGIYPEWGSADPTTGRLRKVHLLGHSLGGLTARLLDTLLKLGDPAERGDGGTAAAGVNAGAMSQLFEGGKPWVESVTAISSPHDGTTLTSEYHEVGSIRKLFAKWLAVSSVKREKPILDLHLDHWESAAADGESLSDFLRRAVDEELWRDIEDFSIYDLSPAGARRLNRRTRLDPRSYYFSLGSSSTVPDPETGYHVPAKGTSLPLHPNARFMGSLRTLPEGAEGTPALWWENDGVVNTCSMDGPSLGTAQPVEKYRGEPVRGVWNHLATLHPCDHWQMHVAAPLLGNSPPGYESLVDFYAAQASLLRSL